MIVAAAIATYLVVAILAPASIGIALAQLALVAVPIGAIAHAQRGPGIAAAVRGSVGLASAPLRFFAAAVAIGATAWYLNAWLVAQLPIPERQTRVLAELVGGPALVTTLVVFAALPAVCEEILFRGVLARALGGTMSIGAAVAISALVFSAYHLSLVQALPTLTLGAMLAWLAIRADSVLPSITAHALNNAAAIAMSRGELPAAAHWLEAHPLIALGGAAAGTAAGLALAAQKAPRHP
jgi:membrane protease YdiL (CAAX protease family)